MDYIKRQTYKYRHGIMGIIILLLAPTGFTAPQVTKLATLNQSGGYVGAGIGIGELITPAMDSHSLNHSSLSQSHSWGLAYQLQLGYLWKNHFAIKPGVEVNYSIFPKNAYSYDHNQSSSALSYQTQGFAVLATLHWLLSHNFSLLFKLGPNLIFQDTQWQYQQTIQKSKDRTIQLHLATGLAYQLSQTWGIAINYSYNWGTQPQPFGLTINHFNQLNKTASSQMILLSCHYFFRGT